MSSPAVAAHTCDVSPSPIVGAPVARPVRLAVVDDCPLVTAGVAAMLEPFSHRVRVDHDSRVPRRGAEDVILVDIVGRPDPAGFLRRLGSSTGSKVLLYSWRSDAAQLRSFVEAGSSGFVDKSSSADALVRAVEVTHAGGSVGVGGSDSGAWTSGQPGRPAGLSEREAEVLALVTLGLTNREIAAQCYLGVNTIKTYIRKAYRKTGVRNRASAVRWWLDNVSASPDEWRTVQHRGRARRGR
jgi:two-component system, NarL family, response regulator LiaR